MNDSIFRLIYTLLPCLVGAYAAALFLTTRSISETRAWVLGFVIASVLTIGVSMAAGPGVGLMFRDGSALGFHVGFLGLFGSLYFIPMIVLVPTAIGLRSSHVSRGVGIVVLIALFLASAWVARLVSAHFDPVNAVQ